MCYFSGDEGVRTAIISSLIWSLDDMADKAGSPGSYEFVIQVDPSKGVKLPSSTGKGAAVRLEPGTAGEWTLTGDLGEVNMGSPHTLWEFLKWAVTKHPAKRYALIITGHGQGVFSPFGTGNALSEDPGKVIFNPERFVAYDGTDDDCLTLPEVQAVLAAFRDRLSGGRPLNLLLFEACLPGSIEMLYQLRDLADLVVSSPLEMHIGGISYPAMADVLRQNPRISDTLLAKKIADAYVSHAVDLHGAPEILTVYRTASVERLVAAVDNLSQAFLQALREAGKVPSLKGGWAFGPDDYYYDLKSVLTAIGNGQCDFWGATNESDARTQANRALECLSVSLVHIAVSSEFTNEQLAGLSIACPEPSAYKNFQSFYKVLDFAKATHWDELLDAGFATSRGGDD